MTTFHSRRISRRALLLVISAIALCAWGGLLLFTYFVTISGAAIFAVFILLGLALFSTCVLLTYLVLWIAFARRGQIPRLRQALREGGLFSAWLLFNLVLSILHSWSLFSAIVSFGIIVIVESLVLGKS